MRRRLFILTAFLLVATLVAIGGVIYSIDKSIDARHGPSHRFSAAAGEQFLTEERALLIARDVMTRDGFPESQWKLMEDDRSKAPDGRPDRYFVRGANDPNRGIVQFWCENSPTPQRIVTVEFHNGEITAQGTLGK